MFIRDDNRMGDAWLNPHWHIEDIEINSILILALWASTRFDDLGNIRRVAVH